MRVIRAKTFIRNEGRVMNRSLMTIIIGLLILIEIPIVFFAFKGFRCSKMISDYEESQQQLETKISKQSLLIQQAMNDVERLSSTDSLTKIPNRKFFLVNLKNEITRYLRHKRPFTFIIIDMDNLKKVNDDYGHEKGDEVLKTIADVVRGCARNTDYVGRIGGQEFGVILPETDEEGALIFAKRLRLDINNTIFKVEGTEIIFSITASMGGCVIIDAMNPNLEKIYADADESVYESKKNGRD